jgi:hypothetical protein
MVMGHHEHVGYSVRFNIVKLLQHLLPDAPLSLKPDNQWLAAVCPLGHMNPVVLSIDPQLLTYKPASARRPLAYR